jgi:hypothetical protein
MQATDSGPLSRAETSEVSERDGDHVESEVSEGEEVVSYVYLCCASAALSLVILQ